MRTGGAEHEIRAIKSAALIAKEEAEPIKALHE
jgi:hypothetical protein